MRIHLTCDSSLVQILSSAMNLLYSVKRKSLGAFIVFIILFISINPLSLKSQTANLVDILQGIQASSLEDQPQMINEFGLSWAHKDPTGVIAILKENYSISPEIPETNIQAEVFMQLSSAYFAISNLDSSEIYAVHAKSYFEKLNNRIGYAKSLNQIGLIQIEKLQFEEAEQNLIEALRIFRELNLPIEEGIATRSLGYVYYWTERIDSSILFFLQSLELHSTKGDSVQVSKDLYFLGLSYYHSDQEELALRTFVQCKDLMEKLDDPIGLAQVNNSLGILHEEKGNWENALSYYRKSLNTYLPTGNAKSIGKVLNNIGIVYLDLGELDSAKTYLESALEKRLSIKFHDGITQSYMNLGELYQAHSNYEEALKYLFQARSHALNHGTHRALGPTLSKIGSAFLAVDQLDSAEKYLLRSLEVQNLSTEYFSRRGTYLQLSKIYERNGEYEKALNAYKSYSQIQDSLTSIETTAELAEVQEKYDSEVRESEINRLKSVSDQRTRARNYLAIGLLLSIVAGIFMVLFFRYRSRKNNELLLAKERQHLELEKIDKIKSRFFHNISHEFRTPLTLILGPTEQLISDTTHDEKKQHLLRIRKNGQRLLKLINQLLEISKIESGKVPLVTRFVDIIPLLKGWVMSFQSHAEIKNIKLNLLAEEERYLIYIDQEKIENIVINLISNAIKFTPNGGSVQVSVRSSSIDEQRWLNIAVKDSGRGIPDEEIDQVFDRFYQASNADVEQHIGTGIGLSLIKELVDLHRGRIEVKSEVNRGTTFTLMLRIGRSYLKDYEISTIDKSVKPPIEKFGHLDSPEESKNESMAEEDAPIALIIEDNIDLQEYIRDILSDQYQIALAKNGEEGITKAIELLPDLIISDVMMPKKDGLEVCSILKKDNRTNHIPIILLTAQSTLEDRLQGLKHLADDFISKPFSVEELRQRSQNLLENREIIHERFTGHDILKPQKLQLNSMNQVFMEELIAIIEENMASNAFGVNELADELALSRSQLYRKVKFITNLTPVEFIRSFRLERAKDILESKAATVSEVADQVGFQNASYFAKIFAEKFGVNPGELLRS